MLTRAATPPRASSSRYELATDAGIGWRADSKRIIVWFGDEPGHDPICADITGLASRDHRGDGDGRALVAADITVVAVSTTPGPERARRRSCRQTQVTTRHLPGSGTPGQATHIATATGGTHTDGIDPRTDRRHAQVTDRRRGRSDGDVKLEASAEARLSSSSRSHRPAATARWPATRSTS